MIIHPEFVWEPNPKPVCVGITYFMHNETPANTKCKSERQSIRWREGKDKSMTGNRWAIKWAIKVIKQTNRKEYLNCILFYMMKTFDMRRLSCHDCTCWTTGCWWSCLSLEVVSSIPAGSKIIYRFLCGFICVSLCQSIKIKPINMDIASARAQFKINAHRCWNWHLCIPDGLSVVQRSNGHVIGVAFLDAISVAWSVCAGQLAAGGVSSVWRSWVRSLPGSR